MLLFTDPQTDHSVFTYLYFIPQSANKILKVLTKNFSMHTLMERLKNLIDLSGFDSHSGQ